MVSDGSPTAFRREYWPVRFGPCGSAHAVRPVRFGPPCDRDALAAANGKSSPMNTLRNLFLWLAVAVLLAPTAAVLSAPAALAETWQMPTPYPVNSFHTKNIQRFAQDIETATGGSLRIEVHPAGALFRHADIKNAVRSGQVQIGEFLLSRLANEHPMFEVDSLPFVATDYAAAARLWISSRPYVQELLARQGLVVLFAVPWPPQALFTRKPLESVADLKGVRLRAYNRTQEQFARLAGAIPTQVEVPDIPQAFATGRVEAMITSPSTGANARAWEFVSHYYDTRAWLPKNVVVVSKRALDGLDAPIRDAVIAAAAAAEQRGWAMSRAETDAQVAILRDSGLTIVEPDQDLVRQLHDIGDTLMAEWLAQTGVNGQALLARFRSDVRVSR